MEKVLTFFAVKLFAAKKCHSMYGSQSVYYSSFYAYQKFSILIHQISQPPRSLSAQLSSDAGFFNYYLNIRSMFYFFYCFLFVFVSRTPFYIIRSREPTYWTKWRNFWRKGLKRLFAQRLWTRDELSKAPAKSTMMFKERFTISNTLLL